MANNSLYSAAIIFAMSTFLAALEDNYGSSAFYSGVVPHTALIACLLARLVIFQCALCGQLSDYSSRRKALVATLDKCLKQINIRLALAVKQEIVNNALVVLSKVLAQESSGSVPAPLVDLVFPGAPTPVGLGAAPAELLVYLMGPDRALDARVHIETRPRAPFCDGQATGKSPRRKRRGGSPGPSPLSSPPLTAHQLENDQHDVSGPPSFERVQTSKLFDASPNNNTPTTFNPIQVSRKQDKPLTVENYQGPIVYYDDFSQVFDPDTFEAKVAEQKLVDHIVKATSKRSKVSQFFSRVRKTLRIAPKKSKNSSHAAPSLSPTSSRSTSPPSTSSTIDQDPFAASPTPFQMNKYC